MRLRGVMLAASVCLAGMASVQGQTPDAASVLARAREALGGEKKLGAIKSFVASGQTRQIRGDNLVPIVFEINVAVESGYSTSGFNGDGLVQMPAPAPPPAMPPGMARPGGPPPPTPEQMAAQMAAQRRTRVIGLKQDFTRLTLGMFAASFPSYPLTFTRIGIAESPQGKADIIEAKGPDNFVARLFINQETHLPVMLSWSPPAGRGARPAGPPASSPGAPGARGTAPGAPGTAPGAPELRLYFADYRDVDGLQLPFRIRRALGADTTEETTIDRYKLNAKIDPRKFEVVK